MKSIVLFENGVPEDFQLFFESHSSTLFEHSLIINLSWHRAFEAQEICQSVLGGLINVCSKSNQSKTTTPKRVSSDEITKPEYISPREKASETPHTRLLNMNQQLQNCKKQLSLRFEHCRIGHWARDFTKCIEDYCSLNMDNVDAHHLVELALGHNSIGSQAFHCLIENCFVMRNLIVLDLSYNRITARDLKHFTVYVNSKHSTLQRLSLIGNSLGCEAASMIASTLEKNSTLYSLDIGSNQITDGGFEEVIKAICNNNRSKIRWLGCDDNSLTDISILSMVHHLRKAMNTNQSCRVLSVCVSMLGNKIKSRDIICQIKLQKQANKTYDAKANLASQNCQNKNAQLTLKDRDRTNVEATTEWPLLNNVVL